jgi:hypothetical protein
MSGYVTPEGLTVMAGGDAYNLTPDVRRLANSIRSIVPVQDSPGQAAVIAAILADGRDASDFAPLYTHNISQGGLTWQGDSGIERPLLPAACWGHMGRTAGFQTLSGSTQIRVAFDAAQQLHGGITFDNPNDALVVPFAGYYRCTLRTYATGGNPYMQTGIIWVNGALPTIRAGVNIYKADAQDYTGQASCIMYLNAGDKVQQAVSTNGTGTGTTWGTNGYDGAWVEVEYVGY